MANIEINTSQNVTIEYELAPLRDRILAFILDSIIMWAGIFVLFLLCLLFFQTRDMENFMGYFLYLVILPIFFFYSLVSEIIGNGLTIGKSALKIKIVKLNGKEPQLNDFITRWVFRSIDIYLSLGSIASLLISSSDKNQRMGDILANTAVIKFKPTYVIALKDLLNRTSLENYQPVYSEVTRFKDEDMLLVKQVIDRVEKHPNIAHYEALNQLVEKITQQLNISQRPKNKIEFLKTLLKDYIVLTR
ncbi:MAG: RDD family protein [Cytophagaceae bacterium]|nr:RDD family protein [Cytophagaceae bacterium]